jgi:hypothetical protein
LLKEIAPGVPRIAFVYNPTEPVNEAWLRVAEAAAPRSLIQDLMQTIGPMAGVAATAIGSVYAGLKGILGS